MYPVTNNVMTALGTNTIVGRLGFGFISGTNMFLPSDNGQLRIVKMFGKRLSGSRKFLSYLIVDCALSDCTTCALDSTYW
jgi:hypothetical protein